MKDFIGRFEGCHERRGGLVWPYVCPAGYWTQGWGRLVFKGAPPQTTDVVDTWFDQDIARHKAYAFELSPNLVQASERRQLAIVDFVYNLGPGRYKGSTLRKRVGVNDWTGAATEIVKWVWGGGKRLPGLVIRRNTEAQLILRSERHGR